MHFGRSLYQSLRLKTSLMNPFSCIIEKLNLNVCIYGSLLLCDYLGPFLSNCLGPFLHHWRKGCVNEKWFECALIKAMSCAFVGQFVSECTVTNEMASVVAFFPNDNN